MTALAPGSKAAEGLKGSAIPLSQRYDVGLVDLDGVVYVGQSMIPGVAQATKAVRQSGMHLAYVTNNASRTPDQIVALLRSLGIRVDATDVITSSQAAAHILAERLPAGARVLAVGEVGLRLALAERGFEVVTDVSVQPAAVVQGYGASVSWRELADAAIAIHGGSMWVATNLDSTLPSPYGLLPGNGALVDAVRAAVTIDPLVAGKPDPAMHRECMIRTGAKNPLVIGDRLDTDIEGANRVGCDSVAVLSGVTKPVDLLRASPLQRPTYISADFAGLLQVHDEPVINDAGAWVCRGWQVGVNGTSLVVDGSGDQLDGLRALCAVAWAQGEMAALSVASRGEAAQAMIERFELQQLT